MTAGPKSGGGPAARKDGGLASAETMRNSAGEGVVAGRPSVGARAGGNGPGRPRRGGEKVVGWRRILGGRRKVTGAGTGAEKGRFACVCWARGACAERDKCKHSSGG